MAEEKNEVTHTPTPWVVVRTHKGSGLAVRGGVREENPTGAWPVYGFNLGLDAQDEANARFIVRACNAYDEMLQVLKDADQLLGYFHWDSSTGRTDKFEMVKRIRAAIKKAEGEP